MSHSSINNVTNNTVTTQNTDTNQAPTLKWSLVFAGANDMKRPAESLSGTQQIALFCTGAIWTRWSLIIKPKNWLLASVNFFLGGVAGAQLIRIAKYRKEQGDSNAQVFSYILNGKN